MALNIWGNQIPGGTTQPNPYQLGGMQMPGMDLSSTGQGMQPPQYPGYGGEFSSTGQGMQPGMGDLSSTGQGMQEGPYPNSFSGMGDFSSTGQGLTGAPYTPTQEFSSTGQGMAPYGGDMLSSTTHGMTSPYGATDPNPYLTAGLAARTQQNVDDFNRNQNMVSGIMRGDTSALDAQRATIQDAYSGQLATQNPGFHEQYNAGNPAGYGGVSSGSTRGVAGDFTASGVPGSTGQSPFVVAGQPLQQNPMSTGGTGGMGMGAPGGLSSAGQGMSESGGGFGGMGMGGLSSPGQGMNESGMGGGFSSTGQGMGGSMGMGQGGMPGMSSFGQGMGYGGFSSGNGGNPNLSAQADEIGRRTQQGLGQAFQGIKSRSIGVGGLGGSRQGVAEGAATGQAMDSLQGNLANLYGGAWESDQGRGLQKYGMDQSNSTARRGQDYQYDLGLGGLANQRYGMNQNYDLGLGGLGNQRYGMDQNYDLGLGSLGNQRYATDTNAALGWGGLANARRGQDQNYDINSQQARNSFYLGNRTLDQSGAQLGANLWNQGQNGEWDPMKNASNIYSPYSGFGVQTTGSNTGGGLQGLLGGALGGWQLYNAWNK